MNDKRLLGYSARVSIDIQKTDTPSKFKASVLLESEIGIDLISHSLDYPSKIDIFDICHFYFKMKDKYDV